LSLKRLAALAGQTKSSFHRRFKRVVGETPKQYTTRLRLERAAFTLRIRDATILEVALDVGFRSHEVFTRAFSRHFDRTPSEFRRTPSLVPGTGPSSSSGSSLYAERYSLSATRVERLRTLDLAFLRHHGPYRDVDPKLFDRVVTWARGKRLVDGTPILVGIGHDTPAVTPEALLRFDACVQVRAPFAPSDGIAHQRLAVGDYAVTTYVGPFGAPLVDAYAKIFRAAKNLRGYQLVGLPALEIYGSTSVADEHALHHTDILLPLRRRSV